jgi:hypothetical protein
MERWCVIRFIIGIPLFYIGGMQISKDNNKRVEQQKNWGE